MSEEFNFIVEREQPSFRFGSGAVASSFYRISLQGTDVVYRVFVNDASNLDWIIDQVAYDELVGDGDVDG